MMEYRQGVSILYKVARKYLSREVIFKMREGKNESFKYQEKSFQGRKNSKD